MKLCECCNKIEVQNPTHNLCKPCWVESKNTYLNMLKSKGYKRISSKYRIVARIDREDWKEYMAKIHSPWSVKDGMEWVKCLGEEQAMNHYLRCYSKDRIEGIAPEYFKQLEGN